jgi:phosphopantothenoylcysteine decarboxylase/phosphopantothenate--cysteine ligase
MESAVRDAVTSADMLVMAAAVSDFRRPSAFEAKLKKESQGDGMSIALDRNPDILAGISRPGLVKIGFAAETERLLENAAGKLAAKGLAMIVANDAVATIGSDESTATLIYAEGRSESLPALAKEQLAGLILDRAAGLRASSPSTPGET